MVSAEASGSAGQASGRGRATRRPGDPGHLLVAAWVEEHAPSRRAPSLDGTLIPIDRVAANRPFYSGKHTLLPWRAGKLTKPIHVLHVRDPTFIRLVRTKPYDADAAQRPVVTAAISRPPRWHVGSGVCRVCPAMMGRARRLTARAEQELWPGKGAAHAVA